MSQERFQYMTCASTNLGDFRVFEEAGWELVAVSDGMAYFKRRISSVEGAKKP